MPVDCTTIPTVALAQEAKLNMDAINTFIYNRNDTSFVDQYGVSHKTLWGYEYEAQSKVNNVVYDAEQTVFRSEQYANQALSYRDTTETYRDTTLGYRDETFTARDTTQGYRDETFTARDTTETYRDETQVLRNETQAIYNDSLATSNFAGEYSTLTGSLNIPASVYHNDRYWMLLTNLVNVSSSEPSDSNPDYVPLTLGNARLGITTPFTVTLPGRYFVKGGGDVTLPPVGGLVDESFDFVAEIGTEPTVYGDGTTDILTSLYGTVDGIVLDNQAVYEFVFNPNSGKLEI